MTYTNERHMSNLKRVLEDILSYFDSSPDSPGMEVEVMLETGERGVAVVTPELEDALNLATTLLNEGENEC